MTESVENAAIRFAALSTIFDSATKQYLKNRGLSRGWQSLEVGGGGGSIARWLSAEVGPTGRVLVTDIDTQFLEALSASNLEVRRHDITRDALPDKTFDLVHTRMVLIHLTERDHVLQRLVSALKPGGWIVCEEFDSASAPPDPAKCPGEIALKTLHAMGRLNEEHGVHRQYGRLLFGRFRTLGLVDLGAEAHLSMVQPVSQIATLFKASCQRRRAAMIAAGYITHEEFDRDLTRMDAADFMMPSPIMWTVWGRRPG
jgi:SAM-dependent methyltransferase